MKHRLLPFSLFIITVGLAAIFLSAATTDKEKQTSSKPRTGEEFIHSLRVNQHTGVILPADVQKAREQVMLNAAMNSGRDSDFNWVQKGPNNLGGRTRAIVVDNTDPEGNTLYAGSVMGGIFKSTNAGANWEKVVHQHSNLRVSCMTQSENGTIYVGTGEGFNVMEQLVLQDWGYDGGFVGQGLFVSSDGENFDLIESTTPSGEEWAHINEISVNGSNRIFVSTNTGLRYSDDGGSTWNFATTSEGEQLSGSSQDVAIGSDGMVVTEVNTLCYVSPDGNPANFILHSTDSTYDLPNFNVGRIKFTMPETDPNMIYACVITAQGALENVYRSDDKGETWVIVGPGGSGNFNVFGTGSNVSEGNGLFSAAFEVQPNDPDVLFLGGVDMWIGTKEQDEGYYNWIKMSESAGFPWIFPLYLPSGHHTYVFNQAWDNRFLIGTNKGIFQLGESGFSSLNRDYIAGQFYTVAPSANKSIFAGGGQDLGTLEMNGTLNPSDQKRGNSIWTTQANIPDGGTGGYLAYSVINQEAIIYSKWPHPTPNGNIPLFIRRNEFGGGPDWSANMLDDRMQSDAFLTPFLLWESFDDEFSGDSVEYGAIKNIPTGTEIWVESITGGRPFKYVTEFDINNGDTVMIPDPISSKFFLGGNSRILLSKDVLRFDRDPEWWVIANNTSGFNGVPQSMAHSADANHLFVGTQDGQLYRISNIRYAYNFDRADVTSPFSIISTQRIPVYLPGTSDEISQVITSISVDPNNANNVVITLGNYGNEHYVFMSQNALSDEPVFTSIMGDLPQMPVYSSLIELDPNTDMVIIGTEYGIYATENPGSGNPTWTAHNADLGNVPVFMIRQQLVRKTDDVIEFISPQDTTYVVYPGNNNYGVIYAATYGRGIITLDEFQKPVGIEEHPQITLNEADFGIYPNPAKDRITLVLDSKIKTSVEVNVYNLAGQLIQSHDFGTKDAGHHEFSLGIRNLQSGTYVVQMVRGQSSSTSKLIVY